MSFLNDVVNIVIKYYPNLLDGVGNTMLIALIGTVAGLVIGLLTGVVRTAPLSKNAVLRVLHKILNAVIAVYVEIFRGTPMMVQLLIMSMVIFANSRNFTMVGALALGINSGAYVAEIVRGGLMSVNPGQMEAGRSLGLNYAQTMRLIVIPQAFKSILPPLGNEFIVLIKETSIVGYVGMSDLTRVANQMTSKLFDVFTPLLGIAFIYFVLTKVLSILLAKLERRLRKSDNR